MSRNVLVIGGGGREHAISWKIAQSPLVKNIYAAPGSHAIQEVPKTKIVPEVRINDHHEIANFCKQNDVELVIVGPEDPLANGIADSLQKEGIAVFGPGKDGARIESDKDWAKAFMDRHGIPTAKWKGFKKAEDAKNFVNSADFPALVVKASGLAAGKGVVVAANKKEACDAIDEIKSKFGAASDTVVIEELLQGEEVSVLAFCDGQTIKAMLPAQDHKRIFDNDQGPNTGGMGAYCPCPLLNARDLEYVQKNVLERAVEGFKKDGIKFVGVLYAGLMLTPSGPKVLEFNCRFGDPETEVILPLLESDLYAVMAACCHGGLDQIELKWKENLTAVGVVMASRGYPETSSKGQIITGIDKVNDKPNHVVFHCGTALKDNHLVTNGGRVLIAVSLAPQLAVAAAQATQAAKNIEFDGRQYRKDISHKGIARAILRSGKLTYKQSGVDITAGNDLVDHIKPAAKSTNRAGSVGGLGGFGGVFDLKAAGFKDPLLVMGTDGVGTKLKIAHEMGIHDTIGIDLVAMCVNDVLAHGAEPLSFLDYYACGHLDVKVAKEVISGVAEGCRQAMCSLSGGETAEMPGMYPAGEYDVAGFTVGAVERDQILPRISDIKEGDVVIGLGSSGVHSNGFSLVRKIMKVAGVSYKDPAPFSKTGKTFGEELLVPTKIYVKSMIPAVRSGKVKAFAHITGGGLTENVPRVLPDHLGVELNAEKWSIPDVFPWMAAAGNVNQAELLRTFNCGIGGILITDPKDEQTILGATGGVTIGKVINNVDEQVIVNNFDKVMEIAMRPHVPTLVSKIKPKKRVGVLISGSGTNLQALIDATRGSDLGAEIVLVISNKDQVEGLRRAQRAGIPTKVISHKDFPSRSDFDTALHNELISAGVELICLAGFMRILTGEFTVKWKGKLINVHPALLPAYKGTHAQRQALEAGAKISGCTVHFVEEAVDCGHYITMEAVSVLANDTEESLTERIKEAEHRAFPRALELVARGKVRIGDDNKLVWT